MSASALMDGDTLRRVLKRIHAFGPWHEADLVAAHIAALEKERDAIQDESRARMANLTRAWAAEEQAKKERDAALSDNAAVLEQLRFWEKALEDVVANGGGADLGWMDEGEATSMLAVIRAYHPGATWLEEHRKALARAMNEGLEKAAVHAERHGHVVTAHEIRNLKEPESD